MSKHTPGPWVADETMIGYRSGWVAAKNVERVICRVYGSKLVKHTDRRRRDDMVCDEEDEANARLIAAVPDLLERVRASNRLIDELFDNEDLRPYLENTKGVWDLLCSAFDANGAAINKAEGK